MKALAEGEKGKEEESYEEVVADIFAQFGAPCESCGVCADTKLRYCAGCGEVPYCSVACQKADWEMHRGECAKGSVGASGGGEKEGSSLLTVLTVCAYSATTAGESIGNNSRLYMYTVLFNNNLNALVALLYMATVTSHLPRRSLHAVFATFPLTTPSPPLVSSPVPPLPLSSTLYTSMGLQASIMEREGRGGTTPRPHAPT